MVRQDRGFDPNLVDFVSCRLNKQTDRDVFSVSVTKRLFLYNTSLGQLNQNPHFSLEKKDMFCSSFCIWINTFATDPWENNFWYRHWSSPNCGCIPFNKNCGLNLWRIPILNFHSQIINDVIYGSMRRIFCRLYCNILAAYCWFSSDHCPWFIVIGVTKNPKLFVMVAN